ncbi:MAG: glycosyltransferase [Chloroflexi bacterium]|nr:glycosyltransferase [Chloroflexota bacterium]
MISVVIPVLNEERLLPDCLRSLSHQDYDGDYEVVVVDNGSTDRSAAIARELGARVITSSVARDLIGARESGARAARGEIIAQADADTVYPPDWLSRVAGHFSTGAQAVGVAGVYVYRERRNFIRRLDPFLRHLINVLTIALFRRPYIISGANFAFLKDVFLEIHGYDKRSYSPDQYGIATRLGRRGTIIYNSGLVVATSARRIEIPTVQIILEVLRNIVIVLAHVARSAPGVLRWKLAGPRTYFKIAPLVLAFAFLAYGYFIPTSTVFGKVYYQGASEDMLVALTFDDGPNDPYTTRILDVLKDSGVKATFFAIGENVELFPATARRIVEEGHVIGNHSYSHDANHALTGRGREDIRLAQEAIFRTVGLEPHLYRPPHGKKSPWELQYLKKINLVEVTWTAATNDQVAKTPEKLALEIVGKVKPGRIILLHDGYGTDHQGPRADRTTTVEAVPIIIRTLQDEGYRFVTVPELLGVPAYHSRQ